jgi:hypothetical protein
MAMVTAMMAVVCNNDHLLAKGLCRRHKSQPGADNQ